MSSTDTTVVELQLQGNTTTASTGRYSLDRLFCLCW